MNLLERIRKSGEFALWARFKDLNREKHDLTYLFWECTLNCNFYCKHCGSNAGKKLIEGELTTKEVKAAFENIADHYDPKKITVAITGGEPLVRSDLFEVMAYVNDLEFPWGMVTNGFLINKDTVRKMKETGMSAVVVSIDGLGETHDKFRGVEGAYDRATNAVRLLVEADFLKSIQITTCLDKSNFSELEDMYETFLKMGITSWRVMNVDPIGRALEHKEELLDGKEIKQLLDFIKENRKKSSMEITYGCPGFLGIKYEGEVRDLYFSCNTGINIGSILHNGDIFVCPNVPRRKELIQGNVRENDFSKVWENKFKFFRTKDRTKNEECASCEHWGNCLGGAFHTWNFDENKQTLCHLKEIQKHFT